MKTLAALIMAAGEGRRFGDCKQLVTIDNKPLVRHSLDNLPTSRFESITMVLGYRGFDIEPLVRDACNTTIFRDWHQGLGASIAHGASLVNSAGNYSGLLITLADQVKLVPADFEQLIDLYDGSAIVATAFGSGAGVPAIFPASCFDELQKLDGERGAQSLIQSGMYPLKKVEITRAQFDIDTREDLKELRGGLQGEGYRLVT